MYKCSKCEFRVLLHGRSILSLNHMPPSGLLYRISVRAADHKVFDVYFPRNNWRKRAQFWRMKLVTELNKPNGLLQWNEDIKPEIALWRERELILLFCHKCESRAKTSLLNRPNLIIHRAVRQKFSLNKAIRRRQGFRNNFHLKHAHRFHPHEFSS